MAAVFAGVRHNAAYRAPQIWVKEPIPADHNARAIWQIAGTLNLEALAETLKTEAGQPGTGTPLAAKSFSWRPHSQEQRLLVRLWVYAYS